jgi:hypothetical protein
VDGFPVGDCFLAVNDDFPCGHYIVCLENNFWGLGDLKFLGIERDILYSNNVMES